LTDPTFPFVCLFSVLGSRTKFFGFVLWYTVAMNSLTERQPQQTTLLDLSSKELNAYWVDPAQPLIIPLNPLHWRAHELQLLLQILKVQAQNNPAQFNSKNYIETLNEYTRAVQAINDGKTADELLDKGEVGGGGDAGAAPKMGDGDAAGVDSGISADNPLAG
jgi:hypothetical protein